MEKRKRIGSKGQYMGTLQAIYEFYKGSREINTNVKMENNYAAILNELNLAASERKQIALRKLLKQLYKWENVEEYLSDSSKKYKPYYYYLWYTREWSQIDNNLMIGRILEKYKIEPEKMDLVLGFKIGQTRKWLVFNSLLWTDKLVIALKEGLKSDLFSDFVESFKNSLKEGEN